MFVAYDLAPLQLRAKPRLLAHLREKSRFEFRGLKFGARSGFAEIFGASMPFCGFCYFEVCVLGAAAAAARITVKALH